jgi:hypothetical protein
MPKWSVLTGRTLKPGSYDEWRAAWEPAEWPAGVTAYILRKADDPGEVIAFGFFEGTRNGLEALRPDPAAEEARTARWRRSFVENEFADGLYEVVEVLGS